MTDPKDIEFNPHTHTCIACGGEGFYCATHGVHTNSMLMCDDTDGKYPCEVHACPICDSGETYWELSQDVVETKCETCKQHLECVKFEDEIWVCHACQVKQHAKMHPICDLWPKQLQGGTA